MARQAVLGRARANSFAAGDADWIELHAWQTMLQRVAEGVSAEEALNDACRDGRRALMAHLYNGVLARGDGPADAFRAIIALELEIALRRGDPPPPQNRAPRRRTRSTPPMQ